MSESATHVFRIALQDEPAVFREVEIASAKKLADLAQAIVSAFDFDFDHAFGFYSGLGRDALRSEPKYELFTDMGEPTSARSVKRTRIEEAFPDVGHVMLFLFDYGDDWRFTVEVIGRGQKVAKTRYPKVLKSVGPSPEQYPEWDEDDADDEEDEPGGRPN